MDKKTIFTILAILILPILAFMALSFNKNSSAIADTNKPANNKIFFFKCVLNAKRVEKIFNEIMPKYKDKISYTTVVVDSRKDMDNKLIKKYNVQLVPTVVMLDSNGKQIKKN